MQKKHILLIIAFLFFCLPLSMQAAGLVPCGTGSNNPCTLCHLIIGTKKILDWGMGILITLSLFGITIAGVMYIVSGSDPGLAKKAKEFIVSVLIGFSLMLGAWLIINTTLFLFSTWDKNGTYNLGIESKTWKTFTCSTTSSSTAGAVPGAGDVPITGPLADCSEMSFDTPKIKGQCQNNDMSEELQTLVTCMYDKLDNDPKALVINSISDNNCTASVCKTLSQCKYDAQTGCRHHSATSCHYGGRNCPKSIAVDFGKKSTASFAEIMNVAEKCNATRVCDEDNHVHVSIGGAECGCDKDCKQ